MPSGDDSQGSTSIPSINITVEVPADTSNLHLPSSLPSPSSGLLSPHSPNAHGPLSPAPSDISETSSVPPSPTLSTYSDNAHFLSSLQLRENRPEEKSGLSSLGLLEPGGISSHRRKGSIATSMTDVESDLRHVPSTTTSVTHVDYYAPSVSDLHTADEADEKKREGTRSMEEDKREGEEAEPHQTAALETELPQDEGIDPAPFHFKPYQLAYMLDPKNVDTLVSLGGIDGMLHGLGAHAEHGLSTKDVSLEKEDEGAGLGASHRHDSEKTRKSSTEGRGNLPEIVLTEPSGKLASPLKDKEVFGATLEDRRRVFGENVLPTRVTKTLLQLMWLALKDKVLVRHFNALNSFIFFILNLSGIIINCSCSVVGFGVFPGFWHSAAKWRPSC